jgi:hypothetical protein
MDEETREWARRNPMKVRNILDHWYAGSDVERQQGMTWYPDAQATCNVIAEDTGLEPSQMAGLVAAYAVQTAWATNIVTAAIVAKSKTPIGGAGSAVMATEVTRAQAQRILNGGHYNDVLKGRKTNAFAHLIFHGGDSPEDEAAGCTRVCIDKHAYSVACGARANDAAYGAAKLQLKGHYENAANCYREAAKIVSEKEDRRIAPHQVQAATWIIRQRLNEKEDKENNRPNRTAQQAQRALARMQQYLHEYHPRALPLVPRSGYSWVDANLITEGSWRGEISQREKASEAPSSELDQKPQSEGF